MTILCGCVDNGVKLKLFKQLTRISNPGLKEKAYQYRLYRNNNILFISNNLSDAFDKFSEQSKLINQGI